jgi:hypothetical protein
MPKTMNTITDSELLEINGGSFARDAGYFLGATASWLCAASSIQINPGWFAEKVVEAIYL